MYRKLLLSATAACALTAAGAQITITSADMPILGDSLRYSLVLPTASLNLGSTGANTTWNYSSLSRSMNDTDIYVNVTAAGYSQSGIQSTAYGFEIADTLQFSGAPAFLTDIYNFFSNTSARFAAVGFAAKVNTTTLPVALPIAAPYTDEDEWFNFPLTFGRKDTTTFQFTASLSILGSVKMKGTRTTHVDGWGTIVTPAMTTPTQVLRVRSEIVEIDSVMVNSTAYAFPRHTVEYQWLGNGLRYPALWVSSSVVAGQEVPTTVRYRESARGVGIAKIAKPEMSQLQVFPNPATAGTARIRVPESCKQVEYAVYDVTGRMLSQKVGTDVVETAALPSGTYTVIVRNGESFGVATFVK